MGCTLEQYELAKNAWALTPVYTEEAFLTWALRVKERLLGKGVDPSTDFEGLADAVIDVALEVLYV